MSTALVMALWRQRLASPMRMLLLFAAFVPPMGFAALTGSIGAVKGLAYFFALVIGAGAIGQDVSSGVLQLTFARPLPRPAYVVSRWFAAGAGGALLAFAQLLMVTLLLAARGMMPGATDLLLMAVTDVVLAFTAAAVIVALSSLLGGLGDLAIFALTSMAVGIGKPVAMMRGWTYVAAALDEVGRTLQPAVDFGWIAGRGAPVWTDLATAASTIALGLCVAIIVVNRKELSYAAD